MAMRTIKEVYSPGRFSFEEALAATRAGMDAPAKKTTARPPAKKATSRKSAAKKSAAATKA